MPSGRAAYDKSVPPDPEAASDEKRPECGREQVKKEERWDERELFHHVLGQGVFAGQCSGRNLDCHKDNDRGQNGDYPPRLHPKPINVADASAEHSTDHDGKNQKK